MSVLNQDTLLDSVNSIDVACRKIPDEVYYQTEILVGVQKGEKMTFCQRSRGDNCEEHEPGIKWLLQTGRRVGIMTLKTGFRETAQTNITMQTNCNSNITSI